MGSKTKRALIAALLLAGAHVAQAATLTVPDEFGSIQAAIGSAAAGDVVLVRAGSYTEEYLSVKDGVSLVGEGAGVTFLTGSTDIQLGSDLRFQGFTVTGRSVVAASKSPTIQWNVIRNAPNAGIQLSGYGWAVVQHNVVYNSGSGISVGGTDATVLNNTLVDNLSYVGIYLPSSTYPTANNLIYRNYDGMYAGAPWVGGYNDAYGSFYFNFNPWTAGDFSAEPMLVKAPREAFLGAVVQASAGAPFDTLPLQGDWTGRVFAGDHVEIGYDKVDHVVTEVVYDGYGTTRARFDPPNDRGYDGGVQLLVWGDTSDFTYDFNLQPGSPCIDAGNPDPIYADADGSRNDVGVTGGTDFVNAHEGTPPAAVALTVTAGDAEIRLSWPAPAEPDVAGYVVVRHEETPVDGAPDGGTQYNVWGQYWYHSLVGSSQVIALIGDPTATGYVDTDRAPGVTYHYAVFAYDRYRNMAAGGVGSAAPYHTARTWVVDPAGAGDSVTIAGAIAAAKPGDTVYVRAGTYHEPIVLKEGLRLVGESRATTLLGVATDAWAVVTAPPVYHASIESLSIVNDADPAAWLAAIYVEWASAIDLFDVTVQGFASGVFYRGFYEAAYRAPRVPRIEGSRFENNGTALSFENWMSPVIQGNEFVGNGGSGVYMENFCAAQILENRFEGNGNGVYVWDDSRPLIQANVFLRNVTGIGHAWSSHSQIVGNEIAEGTQGIYAVSMSSPTIVNNVIRDNSGEGLWLFLNWPRVYNNTIVGNGGNGVQTQYYGSVDLRNNVIAFNGGWGTWAGETYYPGYPNLNYNDVYGNGLGDTSPGSRVYEGNLSVDPAFRDRAGGDLRLAAGSPCIDAGDPAEAFRDANGSRNDMGAWGGPTALPGGEPTIDEQFGGVESLIIVLPDSAFRNEAAGRKAELEVKLDEVLGLISAADASTDATERLALYQSALSKLQNDILAKADGWFGGKKKNDWIVSLEAQQLVHPLIVDLINSVQMRIATL
jgi:parallel beta-helix repeat protein